MFTAYTFLYTLSLCALGPRAVLHRLTGGRYGTALGERLGRVPERLAAHRGAIWIHAVSVGEAHAARGLIPHLRRLLPGVPIVLSTTTPTGQGIARAAGADAAFYAPLDLPRAVDNYLEALEPIALLLVETEIWPNLLRACGSRGIPVAVVNGRLSAASAHRYRWLGHFWSAPLGFLDLVCARTEREARRFASIGVPRNRVLATGNLKADAWALTPPPDVGAALKKALAGLAGRPLVVAGCTMDHEEEKVLLAFRRLQEHHPKAALLLAPRHPERFAEVEALARNAGFAASKRSSADTRDADVIVLDSIGELPAAYGLGDVAFVGGSLVSTGGHNLLEPAIQRRPVIFGPSTENFANLADQLVRAGGGLRVADAEALARQLGELLEDEQQRERVGRRAYEVARRDAAAGARTARVLLDRLSLARR